MKFFLDNITKNPPKYKRLGTLRELEGKPNVVINTPNLLLYTQGGQVPFITHDILKNIKNCNHILQIPIPSIHVFCQALKHYNGTLAKFIGCEENLTCVTIQDPSTFIKQGHSANHKVPTFTFGGKQLYDSVCFMDLIESCKPDMYFILSDGDTNFNSSQKRITKSVNNTLFFYKQCLYHHQNSKSLQESLCVAPIVGGYDLKARKECIESVLDNIQGVGGFLIDGLYNNGLETEKIKFDEIHSVVEFILDRLPEDKIRCIQGCWSPSIVLDLIDMGVDLFDTSYCYSLTERCAAMTFAINSTDASQSEEINLRNSKYVDDCGAIMKNCECLACKNYMRCYIHHLLSVNELLGRMLIMIHNMHHYLRFFDKIRQSIKDNTFDQFHLFIAEQFSAKTSDENLLCINDANSTL